MSQAINSTTKGNTTMLPLNSIITQLSKLQSHTALMAQLTQAVQSDVININRRDLQLAFDDIQQTLSGICTQLSDIDESSETYIDQYDQPMNAAIDVQMTEPCIVIRGRRLEDKTTHHYVPSISEEQRNKCTLMAAVIRYGVELPVYYHDIDVKRFTEKTYYDENGDKQRVLVPLFKERHEGEHTQAFYQRVGLLLPPID